MPRKDLLSKILQLCSTKKTPAFEEVVPILLYEICCTIYAYAKASAHDNSFYWLNW